MLFPQPSSFSSVSGDFWQYTTGSCRNVLGEMWKQEGSGEKRQCDQEEEEREDKRKSSAHTQTVCPAAKIISDPACLMVTG